MSVGYKLTIKTFFNLLFCLVLALAPIVSCTKKQFSANKGEDINAVPLTFNSSNSLCSQFTLIRPQVDFLFMWDNSSSQTFVNDSTKAALSNTINFISDRFDYHIMLAPLIVNENEDVNKDTFLVSFNTNNLGSSALSKRISTSSAPSKLNTYATSTNSEERGLERAYNLINSNRTNGIFRQNAYLIVVLMSNGNDQRLGTLGKQDPGAQNNYIATNQNNFTNLKNNILNSTQIRFISLIAHSECQDGWRIGETYYNFSNYIYNLSKTGVGHKPSDQDGDPTPDSYNICSTDFVHLFDGINNTVLDTVIAHRYNFWPVSFQESPITFNPETIRVTKSTGEEFYEVAGAGNGSGWSYIGWQNNHPTTFEPTVGENKSAHMIELFDDARVTYPECLIISYESPTYFFGYMAMNSKPVVETIQVKINGATIPQSTTNGWEYLGFSSSINLKIQGPNNPSNPYAEALPADQRSNVHVIRLNGNAIYKSGDSISVTYDPSGS